MKEKIVVKRGGKSANQVEPEVAVEAAAIIESAPPKPRKRLYVHIGMHKTGTTAIQYALHNNFQKVTDSGYIVPMTGRSPRHHVQHALISEMFSNHFVKQNPDTYIARQENLIAVLEEEINSFEEGKIILTSENFWHFNHEDVLRFSAAFEKFDIEPIFFIRSLSDYVDSFASTMIAKNYFLASELREKGSTLWTSHLNFDLFQVASRWASIAHDGKIWIEDYDAAGGIDSVAAFLQIVGLDDSIFIKDDYRYNKSIPSTLVYMKYELIRRGFDANLADQMMIDMSSLRFIDKATIIEPDLRAETNARYRDMYHLISNSPITKTRAGILLNYNKLIERPVRQTLGLSGVLHDISLAIKFGNK